MRWVVVALLLTAGAAQAQSRLPPDFVHLRAVDASIAQDIRYASANNFTGRPLPGYGAAECVLRRDAAYALKRVQDSLRSGGLSLKVYDCYRPQRAVNAMAKWASAREDGSTKRFYPDLDKRTLFSGWIALRSRHSAGTAVDLTLVPNGSTAPPFDPRARYGNCDAPVGQRAPDDSLDMGTSFDCLNTRSYTQSRAVGAPQRANRERLLAAMTKQGFHNYFREWWHFEYRRGPEPVGYVVPIPHVIPEREP
jgi:D-alanyl-D-alanine dipeptidase